VFRSPGSKTENGAFAPSKNRQFPPFFPLPVHCAGTGMVVGQAFRPDIPNVRLESLT